MRLLQGLDTVREKVRARDGFTCQLCGKVWDGISRRFDIHHLENLKPEEKTYSYDSKNTDKLVTLCHKCHLGGHHHGAVLPLGMGVIEKNFYFNQKLALQREQQREKRRLMFKKFLKEHTVKETAIFFHVSHQRVHQIFGGSLKSIAYKKIQPTPLGKFTCKLCGNSFEKKYKKTQIPKICGESCPYKSLTSKEKNRKQYLKKKAKPYYKKMILSYRHKYLRNPENLTRYLKYQREYYHRKKLLTGAI